MQETLERPIRPAKKVNPVPWNGDRLKFVRIAAGLSQAALGVAAGYGQAAISHWEVGARVPGADELYALADALGVSCEVFRQPVDAEIRWLPGRRPRKIVDDD